VGVTGYKVFRDGGTTPIGTVASGTTFADTGLAPSSTHSYTVVAVDAAGNQAGPSTAEATTLAAAVRPAHPTRTGLPAVPAKPIVTVSVPRGIIPHDAPILVGVRTQPEADAIITLRLTRRGTHCTGTARHRVCASVTTVLAQRVMHGRANGQGLVSVRVPLGYAPARTLRATLSVRVATHYGTVTHETVVLLQPAARARQR
jgi:hypothetical protein